MNKKDREITPTKRALARIGSLPEFKTLEKIINTITYNEMVHITRLNENDPIQHSIETARRKGGILALKKLVKQINEAVLVVDNE